MRTLARSLTLVGVVVVTLGMTFGTSSAQPTNDDLTIVVESPQHSVVLGDSLDLTVTVTNGSSSTSDPLVVHLDITDPLATTSVDPEDWTPTLSRPIGQLAPGEEATVDWTVQPIAGGIFGIYTVILSPGSATATVSNVVELTVADQRSLNPSGILPVAVGAPAVVGGLLVLQLRRTRRGN